MAKATSTKNGKFVFKGFVNLDFNDAEKIVVADWLTAFKPDAVDSIVVLAEAEFKVGIAYDDYHGVYHISLTCKKKRSPYYGYCFTLRHADVDRGIGIMRYVYDSLLEKELYKLGDEGGKFDW